MMEGERDELVREEGTFLGVSDCCSGGEEESMYDEGTGPEKMRN
jgi:hypothetical protein